MILSVVMREINDIDRYIYVMKWRYNKRTKEKRIVITRTAKLQKGHRVTILELSSFWKRLSDDDKIVFADSSNGLRIFNKDLFNEKFKNCQNFTLEEAITKLKGEYYA